MSKKYEVTFTVKVTEIVEARDEFDAECVFSECFNGPEDIVEMGTYEIKELV